MKIANNKLPQKFPAVNLCFEICHAIDNRVSTSRLECADYQFQRPTVMYNFPSVLQSHRWLNNLPRHLIEELQRLLHSDGILKILQQCIIKSDPVWTTTAGTRLQSPSASFCRCKIVRTLTPIRHH